MKNKLTIGSLVVVIMLGGLFVSSCVNPFSSTTDRGVGAAATLDRIVTAENVKVDIGDKAPNFTAVDVVTGQPVTLQQFTGKMVILNFVNYGCNPQINDIVSTQLLAIKELAGQRSDFVPVSVFCGCCSPETLRNFATENGFNWPWILDSDYTILAQYNKPFSRWGYPTLVFINRVGTITEVTGSINLVTLAKTLDVITAETGTAQ